VIYNRRLRNDAELSRKRAKAGAKGAEATNRRFQDYSDLPRQNSGKASGKSAAPEARSQKPERREDKPLSRDGGLPDWVPREEWRGWAQMRVRKKKPLSERAITRAVNKLDDLRQKGHDPAAVLAQSEFHCWDDLYELKKPDEAPAAPTMFDRIPPRVAAQ
jgi:hypothetical protein